MAKGTCLKNLCICMVGHFKHNHADVKKWVQAGGGIIHTTVGKDTTHLIVSPDQWRKKIAPALAQHDSKLEKVHIVNYSWLEDSMRSFAKRSERQYLWQKLEEKQQKKDNLKLKEKAKAAKIAEKETEKLQKAAEKDKERATKAAIKAATTVDYREAFVDHLKTMSGTADKTRSYKELSAEKSHAFTDEHGLCYNMELSTKANGRVNLILTETTAQSSTYGVSITCLDKKPKPVKIVALLGASMPTALRTFKKSFIEHTGVAWDDRNQISGWFTMKGSRRPTPIQVIEIEDD